jgi:hypothetical protein
LKFEFYHTSNIYCKACSHRKGCQSKIHHESKIQSVHTYYSVKMGTSRSNKASPWMWTCYQGCRSPEEEVQHWEMLEQKEIKSIQNQKLFNFM